MIEEVVRNIKEVCQEEGIEEPNILQNLANTQ